MSMVMRRGRRPVRGTPEYMGGVVRDDDVLPRFAGTMYRYLDAVPLPLLLLARDGRAANRANRVRYVNDAFVKQIGYTQDDVRGMADWLRLAFPDEHYRNEIAMRWEQALLGCDMQRGGLAEIELLVTCKDGGQRWFVMSALQDHALLPDMGMIGFHDVHELKQSLNHSGQLARTDVVTGLLNRRAGEEALGEMLRQFPVDGSGFSLVLCDIDRFKQINDTHGHDAGDAALRLVADSLAHGVRGFDRVARWGGDEFLLALPVSDACAAMKIAERLRARIEGQAFLWNDREVPLSISAGCVFTHKKFDRETLLAAADFALYQAKRDGRNCVRLFGDDGGSPCNMDA